MSSTAPTSKPVSREGKEAFDPESYRMTLGEHLEDLRKRVLLGLVGLVLMTCVCLYFGEHALVFFCQPLIDGLKAEGLSAQLYNNVTTGVFMLYLKVSLILAAAFSGPWMIYQLWQFVAAGLYPNERKTITRFIPVSLALFVGGLALAYYLVMPLTVRFLLAFNTTLSLHTPPAIVDIAPEQVVTVPHLQGDPRTTAEGQLWYNEPQGRLKMVIGGQTRVIPFGPDAMVTSQITIEDYVNLTLMTLLVFGLAFQLPLVVLALFTVGILDMDALKRSRRIVYFALSIAAAVIAPGDVVTAMLALYIPLILLYELGIVMCWRVEKRRQREFEAGA